MLQYPPKDFSEQLSLLAHRRDLTASRLEFLKWVVLTAGAIGSFVLIDYQQERRADEVERTQLKISLFENYIDENDGANLLLWERKLRKLEAFVQNDASLVEFARKEREQLNALKAKEEEARRLVEENRQLNEALASLQQSNAIPSLSTSIDLTNPATLQTIPLEQGSDSLPEETLDSIVEFNTLVNRSLENAQKMNDIERDFKDSGLALRVLE